MVITYSEKAARVNYSNNVVDFKSITTVEFDILSTIENEIYRIIENDKKLVNPVFLFVQDGIVSKIASFLAGQIKRPVSVGIAGSTASGKSTFAFDVIDSLLQFQDKHSLNPVFTRVNTDDYYFDRSEMVKAAGGFANFAKNYDFDVPDAFELDLLKKHINQLVQGKDVMLPKYDMSGTAIRHDNHTLAKPSSIILAEGLFTLTDKVRDVFDIKIYVDVTPEVQRERFYKRAAERGLGDAADRVYNNAVSKAEIYVKPSAKKADIVINGEASRDDYREVTSKFIELIKYAYSEFILN
jgi:uridine kinase